MTMASSPAPAASSDIALLVESSAAARDRRARRLLANWRPGWASLKIGKVVGIATAGLLRGTHANS